MFTQAFTALKSARARAETRHAYQRLLESDDHCCTTSALAAARCGSADAAPGAPGASAAGRAPAADHVSRPGLCRG